jgi:signal peptide peptidase SppA
VKLQWLIQQVFYEPSLITPEAHASIRQLLQSRLGDEIFSGDEAKQRTGKDICGKSVELPSMRIIDGIAHIPIGGAIGQKLGAFAKGWGAVDVADVAADLDEAQDDDRVRGAILDMDTPGGMVAGTPELSSRVEEFGRKKPIYAFTDNMIASAGYWLAASTHGIFSTLTASTGSIGVYVPFYDYTKAYEAEGVKVELIKAGTLKGMGFPGTSLSAEQRAHLQARVDGIYSMFTGHVTSHRSKIEKETMQGQTFMGPDAYKRGLIDAIVKSKADVAALIPK